MRGQSGNRRHRLGWILVICIGLVGSYHSSTIAGAQPGCATRWAVVGAHPDDDIIFMLPDIKNQVLNFGICLDVIFITSGDAGSPDLFYAQNREKGALSDYLALGGFPVPPLQNPYPSYTQSPITVAGRDLTRYTSNSNPAIAVHFLRLLDGGPSGTTLPASLKQLYENADGTTSVPTYVPGVGYNGPGYQKSALINVLAGLFTSRGVSAVYTQDSVNAFGNGDHADHMFGARFARDAAVQAGIATRYPYLGYPSSGLPQNVFGSDLTYKLGIYDIYKVWDGAVPNLPVVGDGYYEWLRRQYLSDSGVIRGYGGNCLSSSGAGVVMNPCISGVNSQRWSRALVGSAFTLKNVATNTCISMSSGTGVAINLVNCTGSSSQLMVENSAGEIRQQGTYFCLDVRGPSTSAGTVVQRWNCVGVANQKWASNQTWSSSTEVHGVNGRCLDIEGPMNAVGTPVQSWTCEGLWQQNFVQAGSAQPIRPSRPTSGGATLCLAPNTQNSAVLLASCTGGTSQNWVRTSNSQLQNQSSGLCLAGSRQNGADLYLASCSTASADQRWSYGGFVTTTLRALGSCIYNGSVTNGIPVTMGSCGVSSTFWTHTSSASELRSSVGMCLDVRGPSTAPGTVMQVWGCVDVGNQKFEWRADGQIAWRGTSHCVSAEGAALLLYGCGTRGANQVFTL